jgi:exonuclease III
MGLRVLSYNIHGLPWIQCPIEAILLWIFYSCPCDVVCFQEVFSEKLKQKILRLAPSYGLKAYFPEIETPCFGKRYMKFGVPSGLCILVHENIPVTEQPVFESFIEKEGLDGLVRKGIFSLGISYRGRQVNIINTHLQADFSEVPCFRIRYNAVRDFQENQLYMFSSRHSFPIVCGDFNKNRFRFFEKFDQEHFATFPATGEHLDHMLFPPAIHKKIVEKNVIYFHKVNLSDHIPVLFEFDVV